MEKAVVDGARALADPSLFGNDAAEDEDEDVFAAYAVQRPELARFADPTTRIQIVRAYKGEGKSALLRLTRAQVAGITDPSPIVIAQPATQLAPAVTDSHFPSAVRAWKQAMLGRLAAEIGASIGIPWSGDALALADEAAKRGRKSQNLVMALMGRLKATVSAGVVSVTIDRQTDGGDIHEGTIKRWAESGAPVWFFVDDVDQNFRNVPDDRIRIASFFVACRELVNSIDGLIIRAAVRPNVWATIKPEYEALSHIEQYTIDLNWGENDIRTLIARRVEGWLQRNQIASSVDARETRAGHERDLIATVFDPAMSWGTGDARRPPHVVLTTLSMHRPRWAIELSKIGAASAIFRSAHRIGQEDLVRNLESFGNRRITDCVAEFRSQCSSLSEIIDAFRGGKEQMTTDELVGVIKRKVMNHLQPIISGVTTAEPLDVAALLFEVGLFFARTDYGDEGYKHLTYAEAPGLLRSRTNLDRGVTWEIHPIYRQALGIRDVEGRKVVRRRPPTRRR